MELCPRHYFHHFLLFRRPRLLTHCARICPSSSLPNRRDNDERSESVAEERDFYGYDPHLGLVADLSRQMKARRLNSKACNQYTGSPFLLSNMDKAKYLALFNERLNFEKTDFTAVLNLARRSEEKSMEDLIDEWDWKGHIEENLYKALEKLHNWEVKACLKDNLVRECSNQMVGLSHAILCRGQHSIPIGQLEDILERIVLRLNEPAFVESIGIGDDKNELRKIFGHYIDFYTNPDIAQKYTIREWWYACAAREGIKPTIYPDIEMFSIPKEIVTLLLSVLIDSCYFMPVVTSKSGHFQAEDGIELTKQKEKNVLKTKKKKVRNWHQAFSVRDLAISELSPHVNKGEKTALCKMLCVHPHLVNYYHRVHEFRQLHFPSAELPMKVPPRPWLDRGQCGPSYTFGHKIVRRLEEFPDMDLNTEILVNRISEDEQARPVFDALNVLGATPWIINKVMLGHVRRALEMSYDRKHSKILKALSVPGHPETINVVFKPKEAWKLGMFTLDDVGGITVDERKNEAQNRELVVELLKHTFPAFWKYGKAIRGRKKKTPSAEEESEIKHNEEGEGGKVEAPSLTEEQGKEIAKRFFKKINAVYRERCEQNSLHCWLVYRLAVAQHFANSVLYFPHNIDFRGRAYPIAPQINHMGDDLNRGLLKFAKGNRLGERGLCWLKLHCINITGRMKRQSLEQRLKFVDENLELLKNVANDPFNEKIDFWWRESEEPWQTLAACIELRDALNIDRAEDFVSHLPIHQDGSCNGLQHYAAMGRDVKGAKDVNLLPMDVPQDLYARVAERVEEMRIEHEKDESSKWHQTAIKLREKMPGRLERKIIKQTIMTTVYGVTKYGARQQISRQLIAIGLDREQAKREFAPYLAHCAFERLTEAFENSMKLMEWFKRCAFQILKLSRPMEWRTPLGLPVIQPYVTVEKHESDLQFIPVAHKQKNAFPPNFVHSLDSTHMMLTALHCHLAGITYASVHDCFWTHACDVDAMNKICREQFIALHEQPIAEQLSESLRSTFLSDELRTLIGREDQQLLDQLEQELRLKLKPGDLDIRVVRDSKYFFS